MTAAPVTFSRIMVTWGIPWGFYPGMILSAGIVALTLACVPKGG